VIIGSRASVAASFKILARREAIQIVACLNDLAELFTKLSDTEPMVALIDFSFIRGPEYHLLDELRRSYPKTKVILLCEGIDQAQIIEAFRHGAAGYVEARDRDMFLARAIRAVIDGEAWFPRQLISRIVERLL
jgi:DNA-binding NarL/FixJ family response regulator